MKTSIICALLTVTLTATLAIPTNFRHNHPSAGVTKIQPLALYQPNGAPVDEILRQAIKTALQVTAAVNEATTQLNDLLNSEAAALLPQLKEIIDQSIVKTKDIVDETVKALKIAATPDEAVAILKNSLQKLKQVAVEAAGAVEALAHEAGPEVASKVKEIVNDFVAKVQVAVQPLIDLITQSTPHVNSIDRLSTPKVSLVDLIRLIEQIRATAVGVNAAFNSALVKLDKVLAGQSADLAAHIKQIIEDAAKEGAVIVHELLKNLPNAGSLEAAVKMIEKSIDDLEALAKETLDQLEEAAAAVPAELHPQVQQIVADLKSEIEEAVRPLCDLIAQLIPSKDLIDQIKAQVQLTVQKSREAVKEAVTEIENLLVGQADVISQVEGIVEKSLERAEALVSDFLREAPGTPLKDLPALVQKLVNDLKEVAVNGEQEIVAVVEGAVAGGAAELERIFAQLQINLKNAVQPLLDLISQLASHPQIS